METTLLTDAPKTTARAQAARSLYRDHGRAVRAFFASRLSDPGVVEDLVQETFLVAVKRGAPAERPGAWLFGIARNKLLRHLRDKRPTAAPVDPALEESAGAALDAADERTRVQAAVAALEPDLREAIRLRYEGGLTMKEIAARLDLPWTTVQGRLKRARIALRRALVRTEEAS